LPTPIAAPWNALATRITPSDGAASPTTDPTRASAVLITITLRLPYRSPSRPAMPLATAPLINATVAIHDTASAERSRTKGSIGNRGTASGGMPDMQPAAMITAHVARVLPSRMADSGAMGLTGPVWPRRSISTMLK